MTNDNTNAAAAAEADLTGAQATLAKIRTMQAETLAKLEEMRAEFANVSMYAEVSEEWLAGRDALRTAIEAKGRRLTDLDAAMAGAKAMVDAAKVRVLASRQVSDRIAAAKCHDRSAVIAEELHDGLIVVGSLWKSLQDELDTATRLVEPHIPANKRPHYGKPDLLEAFFFVLSAAGGPALGPQGITYRHFLKHPPSLGGMVASAAAKLQQRIDAELGKLPADETTPSDEPDASKDAA
jgi:hypothetical protein